MKRLHKPPTQIDGIGVISNNQDVLPSGEWIVTMIPEDPSDNREWEFNLTTGGLKYTHAPHPGWSVPRPEWYP